MTYGIPVWGNADRNNIQRLETLQKKAIRAITHSDYNAHSKPIFKDLQLLSFDDSFKYKVASLMWDFDHDNLPSAFSTLFSKRNNDHDHLTRMATSDKLTIPKTNNLNMV